MAVATATATPRGRAAVATRGLLARARPREDGRLLIAGVAIAGAIVTGMVLKSDALMMAGSLAAIVAGLAYPALGLVVLAFMGPLKSPSVIPAPGFDLALVVVILLGCVYRLPIERPRLQASTPLLLLLAFGLYVFVQQLPDMVSGYAGDRSHEVGYLFFQLLAGLGTVVAAGFILRGRSPYPVLAALLLSAMFAAILAIVTADSVPFAGLSNLVPRPDVGSRAAGPFGNPNVFGQLVAYASVLAVGWFASTQSRPLRAALLAALGIMAYAISLSLSRGAVAALLAGLVTLAFVRSRTLGLATVAAALIVVIVGYPLFVDWRLTTETGSASSAAVVEMAASDESRLSAVLAGPALFAMSPVFGIGFGQYKFMSALVADEGGGLVAHNWYGTVLAEQGLTGVVLWLLMLVGVGAWLRSRPPIPRSIGAAMLCATVTGCLFLALPINFQVAVLPLLVVTAALVADWTPGGPGRATSGPQAQPAATGTPSAAPGPRGEALGGLAGG